MENAMGAESSGMGLSTILAFNIRRPPVYNLDMTVIWNDAHFADLGMTTMAVKLSTACLLTFYLMTVTSAAALGDFFHLKEGTDTAMEQTQDSDVPEEDDDNLVFDMYSAHEINDVMHVQKYVNPSDIMNKWVNQHKYTYTLNADKCGDDVFVLALVKTEPGHFVERQDVRDTWGSVTSHKGATVVPVFIMGKTNPANKKGTVQQELLKESVKYGDIVQGDFLEHYKNQTYKTVMGLAWADEFCNKAKFVMFTSDSTMVDTYHLIDFLKDKTDSGNSENMLYCSAFFDLGPVRDPSDKMYVNIKDYPYKVFPTHCEGFAYILSNDVHKKLLEASKTVPFLWLDDVYVTGLLADKAEVKHTDMAEGHSYNWMQDEHLGDDVTNSLFLLAPYEEIRQNWNKAWAAIKSKRT